MENNMNEYWLQRQDSNYIRAAHDLCAGYSNNINSVLDVGSNETPILEWFRGKAKKLVSLDMFKPYRSEGIESVKANLFDYNVVEKFDIVLCFQTIEHIENAFEFSQKLLTLGKIVVVSVPYKWRKGFCKWHVQDPVDEEKLYSWFQSPPIFKTIKTENDGLSRIICIYRGKDMHDSHHGKNEAIKTAFSHFDLVEQKYGMLNYMNLDRAKYLKNFIEKNKVVNMLELGFYHGKSSAYIGAIFQDRGGPGALTTIDRSGVEKLKPNIYDIISDTGLSERITPLIAQRSYTWELGKLIRANQEKFDLCYLDGGHTWDTTGFGLLLVDMLLKPGGYIIFDDLNWTIASHLRLFPSAKEWGSYSIDEIEAKGVRMVFEVIAPHLGYTDLQEVKEFGWGIAKKRQI